MSLLDTLPDDLVVKSIAIHLSPYSIIQFSHTCKRMYRLIHSEEPIWWHMLKDQWRGNKHLLDIHPPTRTETQAAREDQDRNQQQNQEQADDDSGLFKSWFPQLKTPQELFAFLNEYAFPYLGWWQANINPRGQLLRVHIRNGKVNADRVAMTFREFPQHQWTPIMHPVFQIEPMGNEHENESENKNDCGRESINTSASGNLQSSIALRWYGRPQATRPGDAESDQHVFQEQRTRFIQSNDLTWCIHKPSQDEYPPFVDSASNPQYAFGSPDTFVLRRPRLEAMQSEQSFWFMYDDVACDPTDVFDSRRLSSVDFSADETQVSQRFFEYVHRGKLPMERWPCVTQYRRINISCPRFHREHDAGSAQQAEAVPQNVPGSSQEYEMAHISDTSSSSGLTCDNPGGMFCGIYGPHGPEFIHLEKQMYEGTLSYIGRKITGDPNVPASEITFVARAEYQSEDETEGLRSAVSELLSDGQVSISHIHRGRGRIAQHGFLHPEWTTALMLCYESRGHKMFGCLFAPEGFVLDFVRLDQLLPDL